MLGRALERHGAVGLLGEPVVDVGGERVGPPPAQRRAPGVAAQRLVARREPGPAAAGRGGHGVGTGGVAPLARDDDRLEHEGAGQHARPCDLGGDEAGAAHRVPEPGDRSAAQRIDHGQDVGRHARPGEVVRVGHRGVAVGTEVDGPHVERLREPRDHREVGARAHAGGVGDQQRRAVAAEVVQLELDAVSGGNAHRPVLVRPEPSRPNRRCSASSWATSVLGATCR